MDDKKDWKDFQAMIDTLPSYQRWMHCEDPEEKALWQELLNWETQLSKYVSAVRRAPMPAEPNDLLVAEARWCQE